MSIKSRLLASALIPVMAGWFGTYPAGAANVSTAAEFAQAEPSAPGEDRLPKPEAGDSVEESGGEDARPRRQAEDAEPAARAPREAPAQAGDEGGRPERPRRERQDAGQPPREAPPQAEDDGGQPERPRRPREDAGQADETRPVDRPSRETPPQAERPRPERQDAGQAEDAQPAARPPREAPPQAGEDGGRPDEARPSARPQRENPAQAGDDAGPPPAEPDAGRAQDGQPPAQPRPDAERQTGNDGQRPPEPRPSEAGRPDEAPRAERPEPPAPPIEDPRTERELKEEAADPSRTDDTVVLPVDNGAAVLDSDKDADNRGGQSAREERRRERERQRRQEADQPPPRDDAEAQRRAPPVRQADIEAGNREEGRRRDHAPDFFRELLAPLVQGGQRGPDAPRRVEDRAVYETDGGIVVRSDERRRLRRDAEETYYEDLARGRVRETIVRPDGLRIVTIYDRYGDVIQRTRVAPDGREHLLVYAPDADSERRPPVFRDPGEDLPPMRLRIPVRDYIVDTSSDPDRDYYEFLSEPPVEQVERVYTVDEVKYSARLRDKVRRIDLDTITFATGSADVPMSQAQTVRAVAEAIDRILDRDPGETFLIEGHTDAVGSDESNLVLSDRRAESVANLLADVYGIPPENLVTQGYGERYLKVRTQAGEQQNRRVTVRRITSLVRPVAQGR